MADTEGRTAFTSADVDDLDGAIDKLTFLASALVCVSDSGNGRMSEEFYNGAYLVASDALDALRATRDKVADAWRFESQTTA